MEIAGTATATKPGSSQGHYLPSYLESAAFVGHMVAKTQGIAKRNRRVIASRVFLSPFWRLLACPFSQHTDAPNTRVFLDTDASARRHKPGRLSFYMERTHLLTSFQDFGLADPIARALREENYLTPTPIQAQTIPLALAGRDVVGIAQTGTGKTAAFALPILHRLLAEPHQAAAEDGARAGAEPDPRIVGADPRQLQRLWPPHPPLLGAGDRRRADGPPGPRAHAGRRGAGRDPRPPARPRAEQRPEAQPGRIPGAGRSRPHARHGLHQRHPEDRRQAADQAADAVLLGDHAEGHRRACGSDAARSRAGRGHSGCLDRRAHHPAHHPGRSLQQARLSGRNC